MNAADFAKAEFALSARQDDGRTKREHLVDIWERHGKTPKELLKKPELSPINAHVWEYFGELNQGRDRDDSGPKKTSWRELEAWANMTGRRLDPWEIRALRKIEAEYLDFMAAERAKEFDK